CRGHDAVGEPRCLPEGHRRRAGGILPRSDAPIDTLYSFVASGKETHGCARSLGKEHSTTTGSMKMTQNVETWRRWWLVVAYAVAMAWVESAVVYYLRTMIDRINPYQPNPLPMIGGMGPVEMVRELATLIMLFTVGALAGRNWRARFGYSAIAFGVWDIFYYVS